jgi:transposase InsO family protein
VGAQTRREIGLYPAGQTLHWFNTIEEAKEKIEAWRLDYNEHRPHSALNDQTPSEFAENFDLSRAVEKAGF